MLSPTTKIGFMSMHLARDMRTFCFYFPCHDLIRALTLKRITNDTFEKLKLQL